MNDYQARSSIPKMNWMVTGSGSKHTGNWIYIEQHCSRIGLDFTRK